MIAKATSLTEAAELLALDKSRVSRILSSLEESLGLELVNRSTRHFQLTPAGQKLLDSSSVHLAGLEEAVQVVRSSTSEPAGHLRLTAAHGLSTELLPEILGEFMSIYPKVTIELLISQEPLDLVKERIDIGIRVGDLPDSSLKARKIGQTGVVLVATPAYLANQRRIEHPSRLEGAALLGLSAFLGGITLASASGEKFKLKLRDGLTFSSNSPNILLTMTLKGRGIGIVPAVLCRKHMISGELARVLDDWTAPSFPFYIVHRYHGAVPSHVRNLCDFLRSKLGASLRYS